LGGDRAAPHVNVNGLVNTAHARLVWDEALAKKRLDQRPIIFKGDELLHDDAPVLAPRLGAGPSKQAPKPIP